LKHIETKECHAFGSTKVSANFPEEIDHENSQNVGIGPIRGIHHDRSLIKGNSVIGGECGCLAVFCVQMVKPTENDFRRKSGRVQQRRQSRNDRHDPV
jgi:hypothetical protein